MTAGGGSLRSGSTPRPTRPQRNTPGFCDYFGNAPRNSIEGPGTVTNNMSLSKTMHLGETRSMEIRATINNVFNTVQYSGVEHHRGLADIRPSDFGGCDAVVPVHGEIQILKGSDVWRAAAEESYDGFGAEIECGPWAAGACGAGSTADSRAGFGSSLQRPSHGKIRRQLKSLHAAGRIYAQGQRRTRAHQRGGARRQDRRAGQEASSRATSTSTKTARNSRSTPSTLRASTWPRRSTKPR